MLAIEDGFLSPLSLSFFLFLTFNFYNLAFLHTDEMHLQVGMYTL
jgi:hypothetical protein